MDTKVKMQNGDAILVMVREGKAIHYSWNMALPHVEFVRRKTGELPEGAWVGTVTKLDGEIMAISSKYFFDVQLPGPVEVNEAVRRAFE
jgi:hypothetical protein